VGFNFRMTDIQGALGVAQMKRLDEILEARRAVAARYDALLEGVEWLRRPIVPTRCVHGYQAYVTLFAPEEPSPENIETLHGKRNAIMRRLEQQGIATRQGTHAAALQRVYVEKYGTRTDQYPNAWTADQLTIALPLYPELAEEEQVLVVDSLRDVFGG
jgi:dTDP-4-amino-4,6-dideoxygalactose transaminase